MAGGDERYDYGGGAGGKIRRRPLRKPATPYDRPPTVIRNPSADGRSGWLSKLVDPASRFMLNSATRLFSSVFGKRLLAPPAADERKFEARHELPKDASIIQTPRAQNPGSKSNDNTCNNFENVGIDEIEGLLKQRTFTRAEFDHLSQLLLSRNGDSFSEKGIERTETGTIQVAPTPLRQTETCSPKVNGTADLGSSKNPPKSHIERHAFEGDTGSHVELAKAYMGSRFSNVSAPSHSQNRTLRTKMAMFDIMPSSVSPPSLQPAKKSSDLTENGHLIRTPLGRSAMYRMARSPYFKRVDPIDGKLAGASTSSQWSQNKIMLSSDTRLKRPSSVLDDDFGSGGCTRRIRYKSIMMSSIKDQGLHSLRPLPVLLDSANGEPKCDTSTLQVAENVDAKISNESLFSVPHHSSETARKILQAVDKLSLSREKSSELKLDREKPTLKLTLDMLNGRAWNSMKDVGSLKLLNVEDIGSLNGPSGTHLLKSENIVSEKEGEVRENNTRSDFDLEAISVPDVAPLHDSVMSTKHTASITKPIEYAVSGSSVASLQDKRAFRMSAHEDSLELDDDDGGDGDGGDEYSSKSTIISPAVEKEKMSPSLEEHKTSGPETTIMEKPLTINKPATNFILKEVAEMATKTSDGTHFAGNGVSFTFSTTPPSIFRLNEVSATSVSLSSPLSLEPLVRNERAGALTSVVDSITDDKVSTNFAFSSSISGHACTLNLGAGSKSKPLFTASNANSSVPSPVTSTGGVASDGKFQNASNSYESLENATSSGVPTASVPKIFSFGNSTVSLQNHCPVTASASSVSSPPSNVASGSSADTVFANRQEVIRVSDVSSISATPPSPAPSFFKFGSGNAANAASSSSVAPSSLSSTIETSELEPKARPLSLFNTTGSSHSPASSPASSSTASGKFGLNSAVSSGASSSFSFGTQVASAASSLATFTHSMPNQFGSSTSASLFGSSVSTFSAASSSFHSTGAFSSTTNDAKLVGSSAGFSPSSSPSFSSGGITFSSCSSSAAASQFCLTSQPAYHSLFGSNVQATSATPFATTSQSASSVSFGSSSQTAAASIFGSSSQTESAILFGSSPRSATSTSFGSNSQSATASLFGSSFQPATSTLFGSSSQSVTATLFGSSSQSATSTLFASGSQSAAPTLFGSSSQSATAPSIFSTGLASTSPSTGFSFGVSTSATESKPILFGSSQTASSMPSMFSFTSAAPSPAPASLVRPVFGISNAVGFGSAPPGNDQMNVEDNMTDDTFQASSTPAAAAPFGQQASTPPSNFSFGSGAVPSGQSSVFQFGAPQNPLAQQNASPFAGGSFSLGAGGGGDKSNRKIIRARRDKHRKK